MSDMNRETIDNTEEKKLESIGEKLSEKDEEQIAGGGSMFSPNISMTKNSDFLVNIRR